MSDPISAGWSLLAHIVAIPVALALAARSASHAHAGLPGALRALGVPEPSRMAALGAPAAGMLLAAAFAVTTWGIARLLTGTSPSTVIPQSINLAAALTCAAVTALLAGLRIASVPAAAALVAGLALLDSALRVLGSIASVPDDVRSLSWLGAVLNLHDDAAGVRAVAALAIMVWVAILWPRQPRVHDGGRSRLTRSITTWSRPTRVLGLLAVVAAIGLGLPPVLQAVLPYDLQPQWIADTNAGTNAEDVVRRDLRSWRTRSDVDASAGGPFLAVIREQELRRIHAGVGGRAGVLQLDFASATLWACARRARAWRLVKIVSTPDCP